MSTLFIYLFIFACGYQFLPAPFIEKIIFALWHCVYSFVKDLSILCLPISVLSILFYSFLFLSFFFTFYLLLPRTLDYRTHPPLWDNFPFFSPLFQSSIGYCETSGPLSVNILILWTSFSEYSFYYFDFHTIRLPCEDATFLSVLSKLSWCGFCLFTPSRLRVKSMVRCPLVPHCHFQITYTVSSIGECDWMDRSPALLSFYHLTRTSLLSWSFSSMHL